MPVHTVPEPLLNPFYSRLRVSYWQCLKMILLLPLAIVRVIGITFFMLMSAFFTYIGLICLPYEETARAPLSWWRRYIRLFIGLVLLRGALFFTGFYWVKTYGKRAKRSEAPLLVVAPHSAYFDPFAVTQCGEISVVAKEATRHEFITGKILNFFQPIYVNREDAGSRTGAANRLMERVTSPEDFPQVFIYPEGTTTNRSCLVQFKPGAFRCRRPVQPVLIRFPNSFDSITWTWDSPSLRNTIYFTLSQFYNRMEVEFLPVYYPSDEEMNNASLYASNVGKLMSEALGIPMTSFSLDDGKAMERLSKTKVRKKLELIWSIKGKKEALFDTVGIFTDSFSQSNFNWNWNSTLDQFTSTILPGKVPDKKTMERILKLFNLFKPEESKRTETSIDLKPYCFLDLIMFAAPDLTLQQIIRLIFKIYAGEDATSVSREVYGQVVNDLFEEDDEHIINAQFYSPDSEVPVISFSDFSEKILRRIEFVKLYAMDVTGQIPGDYPKREQRDHPREKMNLDLRFHNNDMT